MAVTKLMQVSQERKLPDDDPYIAPMRMSEFTARLLAILAEHEPASPITGPRLESPAEFGARRIGRSETWVRHAITCGLPTVMLGASVAIDPVEAIAWLRVHGAKCVMPSHRGGR